MSDFDSRAMRATRAHRVSSSLLGVLAESGAPTPPLAVRRAAGFCNELLELTLPGREPLMIKRARHSWGASRLHASRIAAGLLRRRTGVVAPHHLEISTDARGHALEAYWRIPLPTLREVWRELAELRRPQALRSWGGLLRRVHKVRLPGPGRLETPADARALAAVLDDDLHGRLIPALRQTWPAAVPLASTLAARVADVSERATDAPAVLLHSDFHMGNVLCLERPRSIRCVGVIDLEAACSGPVEADVAKVQVLHGPALGAALPAGWVEHFARGYGASLDPVVLAFFRAEHLLNLGYHAATAGWWEHVRRLQSLLADELK